METLREAFAQMERAIEAVVRDAPPHSNFVRHEAFAAPKPH